MNHKRQAVMFLIVGVSLALAACTTTPQPSAESSTTSTLSTPPEPGSQSGETLTPVGAPTVLTTGLTTPWSIVFLDATALISSRNDGVILELLPAGDTRLVGTVEGVRHAGESGLLGLALDDERRLYAYSTGDDGNRIQRFALSGSPGSLQLGIAETILDGLPSASYHDGGRIAFGPDGMLYATVGDAGNRSSAQDLNRLGGKILRMTPDGEAPDDNPFPGSLVYSYGHRNPQGIAWAADGTMFASEFGQDTWDELNIITPGSNYGWPDVEGVSNAPQYVDPVQQWAPDEASPSGVTIIGGTIFIANLRGEILRTVPVADPSTSADLYAGEYGRIRDVVTGPGGSLWFITTNTDSNGTPGADDDRLLSVQLTG